MINIIVNKVLLHSNQCCATFFKEQYKYMVVKRAARNWTKSKPIIFCYINIPWNYAFLS